jgi:RpiR family carbohydrate utilization transcriptional regulator
MGYDGRSEFKLKLAGSLVQGLPFIHRGVDADDLPATTVAPRTGGRLQPLLREMKNHCGPRTCWRPWWPRP